MTDFDTSRFAVIADIHGNADALAAVLDDIDRQTIGSVVNLGDHLSGPTAARETAEMLMARDLLSIRGNHDRWLTEQAPDEMGSIDRVAHAELDSGHLDWLRTLPATLRLGDDIFACHGTPASDLDYWLDHATAEGGMALRPQDEIAARAEGTQATLMLCGHTHLPRRIDLAGGRIVLNPGSVGCPAYTDDEPVFHTVQSGTAAACYAVVERTERGWLSSFRHVPYDPSRMIERARAADHAYWVPRLATGWAQ